MATELKIGQLAKVAQTSAPTIRYYEDIGLLPTPARQAGSQRVYTSADVRRLTFIRRCRDFGFPIEKVRALAALMDTARPCTEARDLAYGHLEQVRAKLRELEALEAGLAAFVERCDRACAAGRSDECVMLEELAEPALGGTPSASCCARPGAER